MGGKSIALTFFGLASALVLAFVLINREQNVYFHPAKAPSATAPADPLVTDKGVNHLYQYDRERQTVLFSTVENFCVKNYHRDSCLHHLATCGDPCLVMLDKMQRRKILTDYQAARKERGLKPVPEMGKDD